MVETKVQPLPKQTNNNNEIENENFQQHTTMPAVTHLFFSFYANQEHEIKTSSTCIVSFPYSSKAFWKGFEIFLHEIGTKKE